MSTNDKERLVPPHSKERATSSSSSGSSDGERDPFASMPTSPKSVSYAESPPVTPRGLTFSTPVNPFSPPASPNGSPKHGPSLTTPAAPASAHRPQLSASSGSFPFPETATKGAGAGATSRSMSTGDLSRMRNYSRPGTAGTAESRLSQNPSLYRLRESFNPPPMRPFTMYSSVTRLSAKIQKERLKSTMLAEGVVPEKPWVGVTDSSLKIAYFLTYFFIFLGFAVGAIKVFFTWQNVKVMDPSHLCLVLDENFDSSDHAFGSSGSFFREVDMSGFGNGEFEMTTDSSNNSYVSNGNLYITPTLTSDSIGIKAIEDAYVYNITDCTYNTTQSYTSASNTQSNDPASTLNAPKFDPDAYLKACSAISNATLGTVINPVQTARLTTRQSASIKYGRVEARAKLPRGDWLWPGIWMLPVNNTYGAWPLSGEIDIMESRGNTAEYHYQGSDVVRGTLNWGPSTLLNAGWRTYGWWPLRRGSYTDTFHTYAMEWDEKFIRLYVDNRLHKMLEISFNIPFWKRGKFPLVIQNNGEAAVVTNPWANATNAAPFDQEFYLILSLGVGGTNGWFPDDKQKPWLDNSRTPMLDFWRAKDQWYSTWASNVEDRSFVFDYVKMWKKC